MGQQDLYQSDFYEDKSRFADVFNGVLFGGRETKLDLESAKAISGILRVKINLNAIREEDKEGREVYDMCKAFDDYKEEGRREGRREGELEIVQMIKNLMKNQKVSFEDAVNMLGIPKSRQKKLSTLM